MEQMQNRSTTFLRLLTVSAFYRNYIIAIQHKSFIPVGRAFKLYGIDTCV